MTEKLNKKTSSLHPKTKQVVDAYIYEEGSKVYIKKSDSGADLERSLIEKDSNFYHNCMCKEGKGAGDYKKIVLDITYKCNLNCNICYSTAEKQDLSLLEIEKIAAKFKNKIFLVSGGEPTVREDLPDIIRILCKKNNVILLTNGIKLADKNYLYKLKRSGLSSVSFSFNGFDENVYKEINGRGLLKEKKAALSNLKALKIETVIGFLLVKGVNEGQIKETFDYCINNMDFVRELRIRSMVPVGRYIDKERYYLSEMLNLFSRQINIKGEDAIEEVRFRKIMNRLFNYDFFVISPCKMDFNIKVTENTLIPFGKLLKFKHGINNASKMECIKNVVNLYGYKGIFLALKKILFHSRVPFVYNKGVLRVGLRSWPDLSNVDLGEICQTGHYSESGVVPFCHSHL